MPSYLAYFVKLMSIKLELEDSKLIREELGALFLIFNLFTNFMLPIVASIEVAIHKTFNNIKVEA